jgi:hypothetical protein
MSGAFVFSCYRYIRLSRHPESPCLKFSTSAFTSVQNEVMLLSNPSFWMEYIQRMKKGLILRRSRTRRRSVEEYLDKTRNPHRRAPMFLIGDFDEDSDSESVLFLHTAISVRGEGFCSGEPRCRLLGTTKALGYVDCPASSAIQHHLFHSEFSLHPGISNAKEMAPLEAMFSRLRHIYIHDSCLVCRQSPVLAEGPQPKTMYSTAALILRVTSVPYLI